MDNALNNHNQDLPPPSRKKTICISLLIAVLIILFAYFSIQRGINRKMKEIETIRSTHLYLIEECKALSHSLNKEQQRKKEIDQQQADLQKEFNSLNDQMELFKSSTNNEHYKRFISYQYFPSSIITSLNYIQIVSFLSDASDLYALELTLKYKATIHGDNKHSLFRCIFGTGKILMLVHLDTDLVIGGYTPMLWDWSMNEDGFYDRYEKFNYSFNQTNSDAFLFSLKENRTYSVRQDSPCIVLDRKLFFSFNKDLEIQEGFLTDGKGYSTFPVHYTCTDQQSHCNDYELTSGYRVFKIKEIEVYSVIRRIGFHDKIIGM